MVGRKAASYKPQVARNLFTGVSLVPSKSCEERIANSSWLMVMGCFELPALGYRMGKDLYSPQKGYLLLGVIFATISIMKNYLIKNVHLVNEGSILQQDVLIEDQFIRQIGDITPLPTHHVIDGTGKYLLPGIIDGQVHFREPGLTHKGDLVTESRAAIAGGVTSFIDMPNTEPNVLNIESLQEKYALAQGRSWANYGFALGVNHSNLDQVIQTDTSNLLLITDDGLYFSGKGNILADRPDMMEKLFAGCRSLIAIHSEKEAIIEANETYYRQQYGEDIPIELHPVIRSEKACYEATKEAIAIAEKYQTRLHILHLSTAIETHLFRNDIPLTQKKITTEASVHHLWFCDQDYKKLGAKIKWNPAIKTAHDKNGLLQALLDDRIDIITTDHAPHTIEEKKGTYFQAKSGAPLIQHSLNCMLEMHLMGKISLEKIAEKMCHNPAILYQIQQRGFIREGYYADLVLVDLDHEWQVSSENILYKCGWSPLEGTLFHNCVVKTFVNGQLSYDQGMFRATAAGLALQKHTTC
jgi:dihydroorotase